jgi:chitosanase
MPNLSTIVDDFNDNAIDTGLWTGNYGSVSETGGRARLTNTAAGTAAYHGFQTASIYTFDDTGWYRVYPQAANGATANTYTAITVTSGAQPAGTSITMSHNAVSGMLTCQLRVGYSDAAGTSVAYSATDHAWWRIRRSGANIIFETAPDNAGAPGTATARRTATLPAWADTATDCRLLLESGRQGGTQTISEFDRVTVAAPPATWNLSDPKLKEAILRFVSTVENGNQQWWTHFGYIEYGAGIEDTRGYTGGIVGWTTATFDMNVLIKAYQSAKPGNVLEKWIPTLNSIDAMATQDERHAASLTQLGSAFVADFQAAGNDPVFQTVQMAERDRLYWAPAYNLAVTDDMSPLGLLHYYDCSVNHGQGAATIGGQSFQGIRATARSQASTPAQGGNEGTYLAKFNDARQVVLEAWGDYQAGPPPELDGRVPACRAFVAAGNFGLVTPYSWNMYGTTHTMSAWPDPYVLPSAPSGVTYRSGVTAEAGAGSSLPVGKPAGLTAGDLMLSAYLCDRDANGASIPAVTGWTTAGTLDRTSGTPEIGGMRVAWKIATAGDVSGTGWTFGSPGSADHAAAILVFTAGTFDPNNPIADVQFGVHGTAAFTHTAPSAAGVDQGMLVSVFGRSDNARPAGTVTWSTTAQDLRTQVGGSDMWTSLATATTPLTATGSTATKNGTANDSSQALSASVVIRPPAAAQAGQRNATDAAGATDSHTRTLTMTRTATSSAGATDAVQVQRGKAVASPAGATDSFSRQMTMVRSFTSWAPTTDHAVWTMDRPDIIDYQFVFDAEPWVPFGLGQTVVVEKFSPGGADTRTQDVLSPTADVRWFGTDRRTPPTWAFDMYTDVEDAGQALGWAQNMEELWDAEELRSTPNAVVPLRYCIAGRIRRVYGRPGNFEVVPTFVRTGRVHMVADFRLAEHTYYDDVEDKITIRTVPSDTSASGFTFPITFPLTIGAQGDSPIVEQAVVRGRRPTWTDVTFYGPSLDPWVMIGGQRWQLRGEIGTGESIRMSGKPWQQGLLRNDGAWMAGMLGPQARLSQLRLPPGLYPVKYGAYDPTGTSRAEVAWRAAYGTM